MHCIALQWLLFLLLLCIIPTIANLDRTANVGTARQLKYVGFTLCKISQKKVIFKFIPMVSGLRGIMMSSPVQLMNTPPVLYSQLLKYSMS